MHPFPQSDQKVLGKFDNKYDINEEKLYIAFVCGLWAKQNVESSFWSTQSNLKPYMKHL